MISNEIQGKFSEVDSGKEESVTGKMSWMTIRLDECSNKMGVCAGVESRDLGPEPSHREEEDHGRECRGVVVSDQNQRSDGWF